MNHSPIDTYSPNVSMHPGFWDREECATIESFCLLQVPWFRVRYVSKKHKNDCTTPCWTSLYSSLVHGGIPLLLRKLVVDKIETALRLPSGYFNVALMRLYISGDDNIAYHSDDRIFLEQKEMAIAGATFGPAERTFSMHSVDDAWDTTITDNKNLHEWKLSRGDLLVMRKRYTQLHWVHAVKPDRECRTWRVNINLRRIRTDNSKYTMKGLKRFYKYCVLGDHKNVKAHLELEHEQTTLEDEELFGKSKKGITIWNEMYHDQPERPQKPKKRLRQISLSDLVSSKRVCK